MRTDEEIKNQIERLKLLKAKLPRYSSFGDPNHEAIDLQIKVLNDKMSAYDVADYSSENDLNDYLDMEMYNAAYWLNDNGDELVGDEDLE